MRVLLDECLPGRKLKPAFPNHEMWTVADMNWRGFKNGALLTKAEVEFDAFMTVDRSLPYQQHAPTYDLIIIVLRAQSNRLEHLLPLVASVTHALESGKAGAVIEVGM